MMNSLSIISQNFGFMQNVYNMSGMVGMLMILVLIDLALKGWGMWRAARMQKKSWFIALLLINSMGILPVIFLLMTNEEYGKSHSQVYERDAPHLQ